MNNIHEWELVFENDHTTVHRFSVSGGHIYVLSFGRREITSLFVPDNAIETFCHHIKEAYNQGHQEGKQAGYDAKCKDEYKRGYFDASLGNIKAEELPSTFYDDH